MNKRKSLLINPDFQLRYIGYTLAICSFVLFVSYLGNYYFIQSFIELGEKLNLPANHSFYQFIDKQKNLLNMIFMISSILNGFVIIGCGLILSNKIAGPLYRFCKELGAVDKLADLPHIQPRKGDYFLEVFSAVNRLNKKDQSDGEKESA